MNDVLILSVAIEQGIYIKDFQTGDVRHIEAAHLIFACGCLRLFREPVENHYEILMTFDMGDYKKTWSLQKEDLLYGKD